MSRISITPLVQLLREFRGKIQRDLEPGTDLLDDLRKMRALDDRRGRLIDSGEER